MGFSTGLDKLTDYAVPVYSKADRSRFLDELDSVAKEGKPIIVATSGLRLNIQNDHLCKFHYFKVFGHFVTDTNSGFLLTTTLHQFEDRRIAICCTVHFGLRLCQNYGLT